jgi:hypothetical protein
MLRTAEQESLLPHRSPLKGGRRTSLADTTPHSFADSLDRHSERATLHPGFDCPGSQPAQGRRHSNGISSFFFSEALHLSHLVWNKKTTSMVQDTIFYPH